MIVVPVKIIDVSFRHYLKGAVMMNGTPVTQEIVIFPADDPKKLKLGWTIHEEIGFGLINDYKAPQTMEYIT